MIIPNSVKIGAITYTVEVVDKIEDADTQGFIDYSKALIKIKQANDDVMKQTFFHEIFHGINLDFDEERVEFLAQLMYQIVKDNSDMFKGG